MIEEIIKDLNNQADDFIFKEFEALGFSREYLKTHLDEFKIINTLNNEKKFFHKNIYLFSVIIEYDIGNYFVTMTVKRRNNNEIN